MHPLDLHVDSIIQQRLFGYRATRAHRAGMRGQPLFWHADVPRMLEAGYRGACLGIHYWPWESERGWTEAQKQIAYLDEVVADHPDVLRVRPRDDWGRAHEEGLLALAPGVEGAHILNGRIDRVATLAELDVAYLTLAHFCRNAACTPSMGRGANETDGLTDFGRELVVALEESDILVDLAHVNMPGVLEACAVATKPLFCTHTGVKGAHDHARNLSDEAVDAIAELDGVIGVMFATTFLSGRLRASSAVIVDHIDYLVDRVGIRHVAIGSDYDGWIPIPVDQRDCRDIVRVRDVMRERGYTDEQIRRVFGDNAARLLGGAAGE